LQVIIKPGLPHIELSSAQKEKIKAAMVKRYNANSKALDLSQFHVDPGERMAMYDTHTHKQRMRSTLYMLRYILQKQ
jgi:hypothetical protein